MRFRIPLSLRLLILILGLGVGFFVLISPLYQLAEQALSADPVALANFQHATSHVLWLMLLFFVGVLAVVSFWVSWWIGRPLRRLRKSARDLSKPLRWDASFHEAQSLNQILAEYANTVDKLASSLRQERDRLRVVLDRLEEGVLLLNGRGIILAVNPSAQRLLPLRPDSVSSLDGKPFIEVVTHEGLCQWIADTNPKRLPVFQVDKGEESPFDLLCHLRPLQPADPNSEALLTVMDVTRFRNLDRAKTDFVANASHELKTPLSSIIGYTEAIFDGAMDNPKMMEHFLRKVHDNALRLQNLVKDLLSLSQLENQGPARAEPLPVRGFTQAAWNQHRIEAERNGIRFENRVPENLIWNMEPRDLDLLVGNLIGNAVRYNRPAGKVQVEWDAETRILCVRDTGQGIPPDMLPHIFERFYRGDPARARGDGTGLGLAIVKHAAQRYGIQVSAESTQGEGSRFCMEVPEERIGLLV